MIDTRITLAVLGKKFQNLGSYMFFHVDNVHLDTYNVAQTCLFYIVLDLSNSHLYFRGNTLIHDEVMHNQTFYFLPQMKYTLICGANAG